MQWVLFAQKQLKCHKDDMKTNLFNFDKIAMQQFFLAHQEKPFRATQVLQWIHQHGIIDFELMTNLSKSSRIELSNIAGLPLLEIAHDQTSKDGTRKWLFRLEDGNSIETVFIPEGERGTLCISSQVGCALNCRFCSTGAMGFNRNLSTAEIITQVWMAKTLLTASENDQASNITNIVLMGMGEPLLNYDNVLPAMNMMMDDHAYGLSKYRVTLSTSGVVPKMHDLAHDSQCSLAVSLHAANDQLRTQLVPINKKYPLALLMDACRLFFKKEPRRKVTFEYTMLDGVNDSTKDAKQLINLVNDVPCKINLIPFNPFPNSHYRCTPWEKIVAFRTILTNAGLNTMIRKTRGDDINAACGQLIGKFTDRTRRSQQATTTISL